MQNICEIHNTVTYIIYSFKFISLVKSRKVKYNRNTNDYYFKRRLSEAGGR